MSNPELIPGEITSAYFAGPVGVRKLSGGMLNVTALVTDFDGRDVVVQQLNPGVFDEGVVEDYQVVSNHLAREGWVVPQVVTTREGGAYKKDQEGGIWRATNFVESDATEGDAVSAGSLAVYGALLADLHGSLAKLEYDPIFQLPHFHETSYHAQNLLEALPNLPTEDAKTMAVEVMDAYGRLDPLPDMGVQLIHGDPRTANTLRRNGEPFTFIDWDTLMKGTIWMDIGDMLRSLGEDAVVDGKEVPIDEFEAVIEGYRQHAQPDADPEEFRRAGLGATKLITAELTMRFIADYKDGDEGYFGWDDDVSNGGYASRHDHNMTRARNNWQIFQAIEASETTHTNEGQL